MRNKKNISACPISRELEFIALHLDEADAIDEENFKVDAFTLGLTREVYDRADKNAAQLLENLANVVKDSTGRIIRITWGKFNVDDWEISGVVSVPRGRKKKIGSVSLNIECGKKEIRLLCSVWGVGRLAARRELVNVVTKRKISGVHVAMDEKEKYPGWTEKDDAVIWLSSTLKSTTSTDALAGKLSKRARLFFTEAKPILKELTDRNRVKARAWSSRVEE